MLIYLGSFYIFFGIIFLFIPLIYIELGRPKDFLKAGLNLIIGMILILKHKVFDNLYSLIIFLILLLISFYIVEIFSLRWNQLTDKEKNKLKSTEEFKKNVIKLLEAISLLLRNFLNLINIFKFDKNHENLINKKWVRNNKNAKILTSNEKNQLH